MDAQSVRNTDTAGSKGYDAGKKVSGIKRHIAVDTQGLPHAIAVTTAEVTDRKGALQALQRCKPALNRVQALLCDSGYVGRPFAQGVQDILGGHVSVQIAKRSELHTFKVMRERAVRMVREHRDEYPSLWAAIESIAPKIGCVPQTLHEWVKRDQIDTGVRDGITTSEREQMKALEREVKELRKANEILKLASAFFAQAELDRRLKS